MARKRPAATATDAGFAPLTERDIGARTDSGSFSRGRTYFRQGRIQDTALRGTTLQALCHGSGIVPYHVSATLALRGEEGENPRVFACTCPRGGFCKHVVALLLTWLDDPARFVARPTVGDLLREKNHDEPVTLVERLVERYPDLERLVDLPVPQGATGRGRPNVQTVDATMIRLQAQAAFARVDPWEWRAGGGVTAELQPLLELGESYAAAGRWADVQVIFTALAQAAREWLLTYNDEEGEVAGVVVACDQYLSAALDAQAALPEGDRLAAEDRKELIGALYDIWQTDIFELGGIDLSQEGPECIARNATDDERAMVEEWLHDEAADGWSQRALTGFLVTLRERAGLDEEELLDVYRDAGLWDEVAGQLLRMNHVSEAIAVASRSLREPMQLTAFAGALIAHGEEHVGRALSLVDDLLWEVEGKNPAFDAMLQQWLIEQFSAHGRHRDALAMAERRFRRQPALQTYRAVHEAAALPGQDRGAWDAARPALIGHLREKGAWAVLVDIFLEEGDVRAALDAYAKQAGQGRQGMWYAPAWGYDDQPLRVARAAEEEAPDEAVAIYRQLAEQMIARRERSHYRIAAGYLDRARQTLEHHGRAGEWQTLITDVRATHTSLRALQEELDTLDLR